MSVEKVVVANVVLVVGVVCEVGVAVVEMVFGVRVKLLDMVEVVVVVQSGWAGRFKHQCKRRGCAGDCAVATLLFMSWRKSGVYLSHSLSSNCTARGC